MLEDYGVNVNIFPSGGGWRYEQPLPTGGVQRIPVHGSAEDDRDLVKQVALFRVNARIDQGDVAYDVSEYLKEHSREVDRLPKRKNYRPAKKRFRPGHRPLIERIADWLRYKAPRNPRLLLKDEADERMKICAECPHNVKWKTACLDCVEDVTSRGQNLRQRPGYEHDDKLHACRLHDLYLPSAVFLDRDALPETHSDAPAFCWMRHP